MSIDVGVSRASRSSRVSTARPFPHGTSLTSTLGWKVQPGSENAKIVEGERPGAWIFFAGVVFPLADRAALDGRVR